ncbi:Trm112 family protein [Chloroflexi bacterium TSY]|nr:Trm112 family protein [Chloroflexi bacterium TSY]
MALLGGIAYFIKNKLAANGNEFSAAGSGQGVIPNNPSSSLEERPLGGAISDELLKILVCPEDKGPLELIDDGKYLLNPRNGYKYPIHDGIPVMLIEEGKKNLDPNFSANGSTPAASDPMSTEQIDDKTEA